MGDLLLEHTDGVDVDVGDVGVVGAADVGLYPDDIHVSEMEEIFPRMKVGLLRALAKNILPRSQEHCQGRFDSCHTSNTRDRKSPLVEVVGPISTAGCGRNAALARRGQYDPMSLRERNCQRKWESSRRPGGIPWKTGWAPDEPRTHHG